MYRFRSRTTSLELDSPPRVECALNPLVAALNRNWLPRHWSKSFAKVQSRGSDSSYERKMSSLRAVNARSIIKCMRSNRSWQAPRRLRVTRANLTSSRLNRTHLRCRPAAFILMSSDKKPCKIFLRWQHVTTYFLLH